MNPVLDLIIDSLDHSSKFLLGSPSFPEPDLQILQVLGTQSLFSLGGVHPLESSLQSINTVTDFLVLHFKFLVGRPPVEVQLIEYFEGGNQCFLFFPGCQLLHLAEQLILLLQMLHSPLDLVLLVGEHQSLVLLQNLHEHQRCLKGT